MYRKISTSKLKVILIGLLFFFVSTPATVGNLGVPRQIPSMQAFLVKAKSNTPANNSLNFTYNEVVGNNTERQRVKASNNSTSTDKVAMRIDVKRNVFRIRCGYFPMLPVHENMIVDGMA